MWIMLVELVALQPIFNANAPVQAATKNAKPYPMHRVAERRGAKQLSLGQNINHKNRPIAIVPGIGLVLARLITPPPQEWGVAVLQYWKTLRDSRYGVINPRRIDLATACVLL